MSRRSKTKRSVFNAGREHGRCSVGFLEVAPWSATLQSSTAEAGAMFAPGT